MGNNDKYYASRSPASGLIPLIFLVGFFIVLYFLAKGLFTILSWLTIPLIIIALVLDYTVVTDYFKYVLNLIKTKPVYGIGLGVFTVLGYPFVSAFLASRAFLNKKIKDFTGQEKKKKEVFTEYEEVNEEDDFLELEPLEKPEALKKTQSEGNDYEDLFE